MTVDSKSYLFVFDLDGTLGMKTHFYPRITGTNVDYIRELREMGHFTCIATDRPRSLAVRGMRHAGLSDQEVEELFPFRIYEDGLLVEAGKTVIYDALDHVSPLFGKLKKAAFGPQAVKRFVAGGFSLYSGRVVEYADGKFFLADYMGNRLEEVGSGEDGCWVNVYQQNNVVRETYKFPDGIGHLPERVSRLEETAGAFLESVDRGWKDVASLKVWSDAIDLYPTLDSRGYDRKGIGLSLALSAQDSRNYDKVFVCCDGLNDFPMVEWARQNHSEYLVVCPSNVSSELRDWLEQNESKFVVVEEDCQNFCKGLGKIIDSESP